jgi:hypothetical protein
MWNGFLKKKCIFFVCYFIFTLISKFIFCLSLHVNIKNEWPIVMVNDLHFTSRMALPSNLLSWINMETLKRVVFNIAIMCY